MKTNRSISSSTEFSEQVAGCRRRNGSHARLLLGFLCYIVGQSALIAAEYADVCQSLLEKHLHTLSPSTTQVMVVQSHGGFKARVTLCQKDGQSPWRANLSPWFPAVIGKNGMAPIGTKREGDFKTPMGFYPISAAFGTHPMALKMDYHYITAEDKFIDDVHSQEYNTWVYGQTGAQHYETMHIPPYTAGAIVEYNNHPIVASAGSAIFIHIWKSPSSPTAGCIAMQKKNIMKLLYWLDKKQNPYIFVS